MRRRERVDLDSHIMVKAEGKEGKMLLLLWKLEGSSTRGAGLGRRQVERVGKMQRARRERLGLQTDTGG
eukprot:408977-Hanusia_phi.AAC.2